MKKQAVYIKVFLTISILLSTFSLKVQADDGNIYVFQKGVLVFETQTNSVDSIAIENENKTLTLYSKDKMSLFSSLVSDIDSITFSYNKPIADLLDVVFNTDGTAKDVSPMNNTVETIANGGSTTYYNTIYKRFVARFSNPWGGTATGFYRIDYSNNANFKNALADGHTIEALVMADYTAPIADSEAKFFSSHQSGGTGFLICKTNTSGRKNEFTFLPNVSTSGSSNWIWANSGVVPQPKIYYHLVGVWEKNANKAYMYVNGELKNTVATSGNFIFPSSTCNWFAIGADPSSTTAANTAWSGDVVLTRIYDKPLSQNDVTVLWNEVKNFQEKKETTLVSNVSYYSNLLIKVNGKYTIQGNGFAEGDKILFILTSDTTKKFLMDPVIDNAAIHVVLPTDFLSGQYRMNLYRNNQMQDFGLVSLQVATVFPKGAKVIAHRGFWDVSGAAQNSRASLQNAFDYNFYGSETDIWLTTDNHIMINHDASLNGVTIQTSTYDEVKNLTLSNGETIPELKDFLTMLASEDSTKLIIEIKKHSTPARDQDAAKAAMAAVQEANVAKKVEYISFSLDACRQLVALDSTAKVAYLNGDLSPQTLYSYGIKGIDYALANISSHPTWITDAHTFGMTANIWTVDNATDIISVNNKNADFVTTNNPIEATKIYKYYIDLNK